MAGQPQPNQTNEKQSVAIEVDVIEFHRRLTPAFGPFVGSRGGSFTSFLTWLPYLIRLKEAEEQAVQTAE